LVNKQTKSNKDNMSISSVNYSSPVDPGILPASGHPLQDLKALQNALKTGSIADAQQALTTFQNDLLTRSNSMDSAATPPGANTQLADDMAALQNALSANDISSAHQAFMTLRHDLRAMRRAHTHNGGGIEGTMPPTMPPTVTGTGDSAADSAGGVLDTQA
jgi:hypothetical protein